MKGLLKLLLFPFVLIATTLGTFLWLFIAVIPMILDMCWHWSDTYQSPLIEYLYFIPIELMFDFIEW